MKHTMKAALAATVILGAASAARADLTNEGAVGLPLNPTAQIPEMGGVRLQANYADQGDINFAGGTGGKVRTYGLFAAGRVGDNIEINGGVNKLQARENGISGNALNPLDRTGFAIGAKYLFTKESDPAGVRIAAGAGYSRADYENTYGYIVGTKSFGGITADRAPITGHLGVRYDSFRIRALPLPIGFPRTKSTKFSVYGGVEIPVTNAFSLVGELQSKNNEFGAERVPYSASIRYRKAGQPLGVSAGIMRQGVTGDNGFFAQLGYTFGGSTAGVAPAGQ